MASQGVIDRHRIAKAIVAAAEKHAEQVGERLQEVLALVLEEGETSADFVTLQRQLARLLEARIAGVVQTERLHFSELDDDDEPRRRRDEASRSVYATMVAIRESLTGAFGAERGDKVLGIQGRTPDDPLKLFHQASLALERLTGESLELPPTRLDGVQLDFAAMAAELQPPLDELARAVRDVDEQFRAKEATIREKDLALDALDTAVRSIGRIIKGFDELAGFPDFSSRIRLTLPARRRSGTSSSEEPSAPDGGEETPSPDDGPPSGVPQPGPPAET